MNALVTLQQASQLIAEGRPLLFAGDEGLLRALPQDTWIGGTIPYFMSADGGQKTAELLFVTQLPAFVLGGDIKLYTPDTMATIPAGYPTNGATFAIVPASSQAHTEVAHHSTTWPGLFDRPLLGWVAGVDLADLGKVTPKVFLGSGASSENAVAVMHVTLPASHRAEVDIINLFTQGSADELTFPKAGFEVDTVLVNGVARNFAEYLVEQRIDTKLPLVADYSGAFINVSFQSVNATTKRVALYAPVFEDTIYRIAAPLKRDYAESFGHELASRAVAPVFACNCILNYLYSELEGKKIGAMVGPITFGEIAYMVLNQTMVYLNFVKA
jgi:hypothetical protein